MTTDTGSCVVQHVLAPVFTVHTNGCRTDWCGVASGDVRNRCFNLGSLSVQIFEKLRFGLEWVWFGSKNWVRFKYYCYLLLIQ